MQSPHSRVDSMDLREKDGKGKRIQSFIIKEIEVDLGNLGERVEYDQNTLYEVLKELIDYYLKKT